MLYLSSRCIFLMHPSSHPAIDAVINSLQEHTSKRCFVKELYYLGYDARLFLSLLNPEAEIRLIDGGGLFSQFGEVYEEEVWAWNPTSSWYKVETDDDIIHPWEHDALIGVDPLSTLGGIDGGDPFP